MMSSAASTKSSAAIERSSMVWSHLKIYRKRIQTRALNIKKMVYERLDALPLQKSVTEKIAQRSSLYQRGLKAQDEIEQILDRVGTTTLTASSPM